MFFGDEDRRESLALLGETHRRYARMIDILEGWRGHHFQSRFASDPMEDLHLMSAVRLVERNPVAAGMVKLSADRPLSSAQSHLAGQRVADHALTIVEAQARHVPNRRAMFKHVLAAALRRLHALLRRGL